MSKQEEKIGFYSQEWMKFMKENHPKIVREMKAARFRETAQKVECSARDYRERLKRQYAQTTPPPEDPAQYRSWKYTRDYYVESAVMRECVLVW